LIDRLESISRHYAELEQELAKPEVVADHEQVTKLARELAGMRDIVEAYRDYREAEKAHEEAREEDEITRIPEAEAKEVADIFRSYGLSEGESSSVIESLRQRPKDWVAFMMRFELGLEEPQPSRAWRSALTIALAYAVGGMIPLSAYLLIPDARAALQLSVTVTLVALAVFGGVKGKFTGVPVLRSALQTTVTGGLAAAAAFGIARWIS